MINVLNKAIGQSRLRSELLIEFTDEWAIYNRILEEKGKEASSGVCLDRIRIYMFNLHLILVETWCISPRLSSRRGKPCGTHSGHSSPYVCWDNAHQRLEWTRENDSASPLEWLLLRIECNIRAILDRGPWLVDTVVRQVEESTRLLESQDNSAIVATTDHPNRQVTIFFLMCRRNSDI